MTFSLTREEASSLLRAAEVALGEDDVAELHRRTEGWAVGLYLAALYLREGGSPGGAAASFGGDDRFVSEYVESEFLSRISQQQRAFLTQTAVLERLCGPLCDAVLDHDGSVAVLADLARSNLLLVPLERRGQWYRYHHLFRDMLLAELERAVPALIPVLRRRAAGSVPGQRPARSCAGVLHRRRGRRHGRPPGGKTLGADLPARPDRNPAAVVPVAGRPGRIEEHPMAAVSASIFAAVRGWPVEAERWADAVDRWQYGARPGRTIPPPRRGPPRSGPSCADAGLSRCVPTPTRQCAGPRRRTP